MKRSIRSATAGVFVLALSFGAAPFLAQETKPTPPPTTDPAPAGEPAKPPCPDGRGRGPEVARGRGDGRGRRRESSAVGAPVTVDAAQPAAEATPPAGVAATGADAAETGAVPATGAGQRHPANRFLGSGNPERNPEPRTLNPSLSEVSNRGKVTERCSFNHAAFTVQEPSA